jgi:hypothetical protein
MAWRKRVRGAKGAERFAGASPGFRRGDASPLPTLDSCFRRNDVLGPRRVKSRHPCERRHPCESRGPGFFFLRRPCYTRVRAMRRPLKKTSSYGGGAGGTMRRTLGSFRRWRNSSLIVGSYFVGASPGFRRGDASTVWLVGAVREPPRSAGGPRIKARRRFRAGAPYDRVEFNLARQTAH